MSKHLLCRCLFRVFNFCTERAPQIFISHLFIVGVYLGGFFPFHCNYYSGNQNKLKLWLVSWKFCFHYIWFSPLKYRPVAQTTLRGKHSPCCSQNQAHRHINRSSNCTHYLLAGALTVYINFQIIVRAAAHC